ncbi:MAG: EthD family reductase [SAR324 cluster bacterium]
MIRVSVLYPASAGAKFDLDYYTKKHMPFVKQRLGAILKSASVDKGIAGGAPGAPAPYVAVGHLTFDSADTFQKAMASHGKEFMDDIPNFTTIQPIMQISEVVM